MSYIICRILYVVYYMSYIICRILYVVYYMSYIIGGILYVCMIMPNTDPVDDLYKRGKHFCKNCNRFNLGNYIAPPCVLY